MSSPSNFQLSFLRVECTVGAVCYHDGVQASERGGAQGGEDVYPADAGNVAGHECASSDAIFRYDVLNK